MEAFAAVVGGVESLHVGAFDEVIREPDSFSRRIARNTQIILREECNLDHLIDPAGGSYCVETLTLELAQKAWEKFQCLQKAGGFLKAIQDGDLQKNIAAIAAERSKLLSQRRTVLVGTNQYAVAQETPQRGVSSDYEGILKTRAREIATRRGQSSHEQDLAVMKKLEELLSAGGRPSHALLELAVQAAGAGATLGELSKTLRTGVAAGAAEATIAQLSFRRLASPYEECAHAPTPIIRRFSFAPWAPPNSTRFARISSGRFSKPAASR